MSCPFDELYVFGKNGNLEGQGRPMTEQRLVVLFGDSLFMDTVEARLEKNQELGVMRIHNSVADVMERMKSLSPDFVIVDVNTHYAKFTLPFLQEQPGTPILCLDVTCNQVVTLSSQQHAVQTTEELIQLVREQAYSGVGDDESPLH